MLINVKIPTIVGILTFIDMLNTIYHAINGEMPITDGILTFISMINTTSESLKAKQTCLYFSVFSWL